MMRNVNILTIILAMTILTFYLILIDKNKSIDRLTELNTEYLISIAAKDNVIEENTLRMDSIDAVSYSLHVAIQNLINKHDDITIKYKNIYLNSDSTDWTKLDSLSTILLNR